MGVRILSRAQCVEREGKKPHRETATIEGNQQDFFVIL